MRNFVKTNKGKKIYIFQRVGRSGNISPKNFQCLGPDWMSTVCVVVGWGMWVRIRYKMLADKEKRTLGWAYKKKKGCSRISYS